MNKPECSYVCFPVEWIRILFVWSKLFRKYQMSFTTSVFVEIL